MTDRISTILAVELDAEKLAQDLGKTTEQIRLLKEEQKLLNKALADGTISEEDYGKAMSENNSELQKATREAKAYTAQLKMLSKETGQYGTSLSEQQRKLNDMQKAYDGLDETVRNSKAGKKFLKEIQQQDEAVKKLEKSTGRAGRSVGSYEEALKNAGVGIGGLTAKMKVFFANPWAILIAAIVGSFKKLVDAFKGSEDRMKELRNAFAPLRAVTDIIQKAFDKLAASLGTLATGALKKVTDGVQWLFKAFDKLASKVGLDWNLSKSFEDAAENSKKATEAEQKYIEHRRRFVEQEAKYENEIAKLRDKAAQKDKYTADERIKFLEEAIEIEKKVAAEKKKLAQENLAYLEAEGERSANSAEENDRLAEARAAVTRADTEYYETTRRLNAQIVAFRKEEIALTKQQQAEDEKARKEAERAEKEKQRLSKASLDYRRTVQLAALGEDKEYTKEALDINMKYYEDLLAVYAQDSAEYFNTLKAKEEYTQQYEEKRKEFAEKAEEFIAQFRDETALEEKYNQEVRALEEYHAQGVISEEQYQKTRDDIDKKYTESRVSRMNKATRQLAGMFEQMADAVGIYAEENEDAAKAQKAFALSGILLNQAQSISEGALAVAKGIESAASIPFPANIPAIITIVAQIGAMIAGVMTTIGQAKQIFAQANDAGKFATGGVVGGTSYTGDKLVAHVNSGEGIYTGKQANTLLQEIANNPLRGGMDAMTEALVTALEAMPAPVMVYQELRNFEQNVSTYDELSKI